MSHFSWKSFWKKLEQMEFFVDLPDSYIKKLRKIFYVLIVAFVILVIFLS